MEPYDEEVSLRLFSHSASHAKEKFSDFKVITSTSRDQMKVETDVSDLYTYVKSNNTLNILTYKLQREKHIAYLRRGLKNLPEYFCCLDASRPWLVYWAMHALELLDVRLNEEEANYVIEFLKKCQNPEGGFGGGPGQLPHLAPTYAAVCALVIIGTKEAYDAINREALTSFLWRMKTKKGAFTMHDSGEVDIRGVYCAVTVATITNIFSDELFRNTVQWILSCQTYEGGFSGSPGLEAHGGYTFCGLAALTMLRAQHLCHTDTLLKWVVNRQMRFEGGFQGRTNKLVDGCYSFWQGGIFPILHSLFGIQEKGLVSAERWMFHQEALQEYLLVCCQHPKGGLIDKPRKAADFYHTCYTLSGLSLAQHFAIGKVHSKRIVGHPSNELVPIHTLFNVCVDSAVSAGQYFNQLPVPSLQSQDYQKR